MIRPLFPWKLENNIISISFSKNDDDQGEDSFDDEINTDSTIKKAFFLFSSPSILIPYVPFPFSISFSLFSKFYADGERIFSSTFVQPNLL